MASRENFRKNLRKYMDECRINQVDLAKAVGVSKSTVTTWLSGRAYPRIDIIQRLADVLECATDDLVAGKTDAEIEAEQISKDQKILFRLAKNAKPEAIRAAVAVLKSMEGSEDDI